ncbi:hypothetical protein [Streptomyces sp. Root369]|uniref:hypothetical protein n=1 Tax=Streptomyces sp. Root369 TaxID=1736523 RepID=UPI00070E77C0|nr:hypothetical protein [Streptomyces sp. Root369]KQW13149.1 hypothetical protein ASD08_31775 [Streptomyces sp. Root369]
MPVEEEPPALTVEIGTHRLLPSTGLQQPCIGVPDLLVPGAGGVSSAERDDRRLSPQRAEGFSGPGDRHGVSEGAVAFDWFDSSTFPVHKGLPPFGSCL